MGISGLWEALVPAANQCSFAGLIVSEAIKRTKEGKRLPIIGIDASPLMFEAQGAAIRARHRGGSLARVGHNVELRCITMFLEQWLRVPAIPYVVFDGANRPKEKRNRKVCQGREHYLAQEFRALAQAFGFHTSMAPGEAEAELAHLNREGLIDFVFTSDSDIFLFGATSVIRRPQIEGDRDLVQVYRASSLQAYDPQPLSPEGLLFLAVVSGGDYCTTGLRGCGFSTAYTLAKTSSLPEMLLHSIQGHDPEGMEVSVALSEWRNKLRYELTNNPNLRSKHPHLASQIPDTFPDPKIVQMYANPLIFKMLKSSVWPGHCVRQILEESSKRVAVMPGYSQRAGLGRQAIQYIQGLDRSRQPGASSSFVYCGTEIWISSVQVPALQAYIAEMHISKPDAFEVSRTSTQLWIPAAVLFYVKPSVIQQYQDEHPLQQLIVGPQSVVNSPAQGPTLESHAEDVIDLTCASPLHYRVLNSSRSGSAVEILNL